MITNFSQPQNSQFLFNRAYSFTLGKSGSPDAIQFQNFWSKDNKGNAVGPSPLRIVFDIKKNFVGSPNTTKFDIYNLSLETRSQIKAGDVLELRAGYNNLIDRIFFGQIGLQSVKSVRNGPDIVTTMECMDGAAATVMARVLKSYPPGVRLYQIIEDVLKEMSTSSDYVPVPIDTGMVVDLPDVSYPKGRTFDHSCKDILNILLKEQGMRWSIQNNSLIILPIGKTSNKWVDSTEYVISKETGMIGIPTKNDGFFEFKALLNPKIQPGVLVKLETSESYYNFTKNKNVQMSGFYEVREAVYHGDTFGSDWTVTCRCWEVPANKVREPTNVSTGLNLSTSEISRTA